MKPTDAFAANRAAWNARVPLHVRSQFYDVEGFVVGRNSLDALEVELLGDVRGKRILHLQCHFGQDTLSLARMGAEVTGLDISEAAIDEARKLTERCGLSGHGRRAAGSGRRWSLDQGKACRADVRAPRVPEFF